MESDKTLFCLVEDVMSKRILQLVSSKLLEFIVRLKNIIVPSHILYADDVLICCKGKISNIKNLISTFKDYVDVSGQVINCRKSFIYGGTMSVSCLNIVADFSGFNKGSPLSTIWEFHFSKANQRKYFKSKPKKIFLQPITDEVIKS